MKKFLIILITAILIVLVFWLVKYKQESYRNAQLDVVIMEKFNEIDTNGDALISKEEFEASAQGLLLKKGITSPEKIKEFNEFKEYTWNNGDVNKDNFLTQDEFRTQAYRNQEKFGEKK